MDVSTRVVDRDSGVDLIKSFKSFKKRASGLRLPKNAAEQTECLAVALIAMFS